MSTQLAAGILQGGQRKLQAILEANNQIFNEVKSLVALANQDLVLKLGDSAGTYDLSIVDSNDAEIAKIDSNGNITVLGANLSDILNLASVAAEGATATKILTLDASNNVDYRTPSLLKADLVLVKGDVGLGNVDNVADANQTSVGALASGSLTSGFTAVADAQIASAATWNAKQDALTFGIADTNAVQIDSASVASGEIARFTANGLESRSNAEMKTQLAYYTSGDTPSFAGITLSSGSIVLSAGTDLTLTGGATFTRLRAEEPTASQSAIVEAYTGADGRYIRLRAYVAGTPSIEATSAIAINQDIDVTGDVGATTIGGITEANLVDKSVAETITGAWIIDNATGLTFNNQGAGADPILSANNAAQRLNLAGGLDVSGSIGLGAQTITSTDGDYDYAFGRVKIGYGGYADSAVFAHIDMFTAGGYCLKQTALGITNLNANATQQVKVSIGNVTSVTVSDDSCQLKTGLNFGWGITSVKIIRDEDDMTSNDATALATQQSIKFYIDEKVNILYAMNKFATLGAILFSGLTGTTSPLQGADYFPASDADCGIHYMFILPSWYGGESITFKCIWTSDGSSGTYTAVINVNATQADGTEVLSNTNDSTGWNVALNQTFNFAISGTTFRVRTNTYSIGAQTAGDFIQVFIESNDINNSNWVGIKAAWLEW